MMYYSNDYLCHYGVLGMKWGQHLMGKYNNYVSYVNDRRKQKLIKKETDRTLPGENAGSTKRRVMSERREAQERVKFYGGKSAASRAINEERKSKSNRELLKGIGRTSISGLAGTVLGSSAYGSASAAAAAAGGTIGGLAFAGVAAAYTAYKISEINTRAKRQQAYTNDLNANGNKVIVSNPYDDDKY